MVSSVEQSASLYLLPNILMATLPPALMLMHSVPDLGSRVNNLTSLLLVRQPLLKNVQ